MLTVNSTPGTAADRYRVGGMIDAYDSKAVPMAKPTYTNALEMCHKSFAHRLAWRCLRHVKIEYETPSVMMASAMKGRTF